MCAMIETPLRLMWLGVLLNPHYDNFRSSLHLAVKFEQLHSQQPELE